MYYMNLTPASTSSFFSEGFFGYGQKGDFELFTLAHFIPVFALIISILILYIYKDSIRKSKYENTIRSIIAITGLLSEFAFFWRVLYTGGGGKPYEQIALTALPIQVCDWTSIFTSIMMLNNNERLFQGCFYVALILGIIPIISPSVISTTGPSYFRYYQFWINHMISIISVFYMIFIQKMKPKKIGLVYATSFNLALGLLAAYANNIIPTATFMYLNTDLSFAYYLPKNQFVRLLIMAILFIIVGLIEYKLFYIIDKTKKDD